MSKWTTDELVDDITTTLNVNGIDCDSPIFFDYDDWDEFVGRCISCIDTNAITEVANNDGDIIEYISEQLTVNGMIGN